MKKRWAALTTLVALLVGVSAEAGQKGKARSNLATGDIALLEQAFGGTARLHGKKRRARPPALGRAQREAVRRLVDQHERKDKDLAKKTQDADKRLGKRLTSGKGKGSTTKATNDD
jgi:hypothetical protein